MKHGAVLQVEQLSYQAGNRLLLDELSFSLTSGELVGLIGPNGAGKSTLLKNLVGFHRPTHGSIQVAGEPTRAMSPARRARLISYMAQHSSAAFAFSVRETIAMGAYSHPMTQSANDSELQQAVSALMARLGLEHLQHRRLTELSGGESQLVHFARVLMQDAPLLLLDEPTASLDIGHEAQLFSQLRADCDNGRTALVAIHNLNTAAAWCDRLLLIANGRLVQSGTPQQVLTSGHLETLYQHPLSIVPHPEEDQLIVMPRR